MRNGDWRDDETKEECNECEGEGSVATGRFRGSPTNDVAIMRMCMECGGYGWHWVQEENGVE